LKSFFYDILEILWHLKIGKWPQPRNEVNIWRGTATSTINNYPNFPSLHICIDWLGAVCTSPPPDFVTTLSSQNHLPN
jgi:hypothetical protein